MAQLACVLVCQSGKAPVSRVESSRGSTCVMLGEWPALVEKWLTRQIPKEFLTVRVRNSLNLEIVVSSNSLGGTNYFSFFPFQA